MEHSNLDQLETFDEDATDLFASPSREPRVSSRKANTAPANSTPRLEDTRYDAETMREDALKRELEGVKNINGVIEGVIASLTAAKSNMDTVTRTVSNASTLLQTWTRILSQTEHNQRLILNENWKGASQDLADMENEEVMKRKMKELRAQEEERRREQAKQRAEDEERQRQAGTSVTRGTRGRGRGLARGTTGTVRGSGYAGSGAAGGTRSIPTPTVRGASGIGRGIGASRGRARGVR